MKIYLAGPISGESYDDVRVRFEEKITPLRNAGYFVLHPMLAKRHLRNETELRSSGYDNPVITNRAIVGRDRWMVGQANIVFADFSNANRVSVGTCFELAWAYELRKHVVVVVSPDDKYHRHAFILQAADIVFDNVDDAMEYLKILSGGRAAGHEEGLAQEATATSLREEDDG